MINPPRAIFAALLLVLASVPSASHAQVHTKTYVSGLNHPSGMTLDHFGRLWVAEHGSGVDAEGNCTFTADAAVVSRSKRVEHLGLNLSSCSVDGNSSGTTDVLLDGHGNLFLLLSGGAEVLPASLLRYRGGELHPGRQAKSHHFGPWDRPGDLDLVAHIFPVVEEEIGAEESNPFRMTWGPDGDLFIADAGANAIVRRDRVTGEMSVFATFPDIPNPLGFGPPFFDAVPTGIVFAGDRFFVASLTGFPFPTGAARIYEVDLSGNVSVFKDGLTLITDLALDKQKGVLYFNRFATFALPVGFTPNTGGVYRLDLSDGSVTPLIEGINFPLGLALGHGNELFVSLFEDGEILQLRTVRGGHDRDDDRIARGPSLAFELRQNSPNPFNPTTTIAFTLPEERHVSIAVYDVVGREVVRLVDRSMAAGEHEVRFDAAGLPSGLYLYRLDASDFSQTRHMILMK